MSMRSLAFALGLSLVIFSCASPQHTTKNYVTYELPFAPYEVVLNKVIATYGPVKSRGEAHITVITPPEFDALSKYFSAAEIHSTAKEFLEKKPAFKSVCLGRGQKELNNQLAATYYIVVNSNEILQFRRELAQLKNVPKRDFDPNLFFPHITIGFTDRDLHYEDGVRKTTASCLKDFKLPL